MVMMSMFGWSGRGEFSGGVAADCPVSAVRGVEVLTEDVVAVDASIDDEAWVVDVDVGPDMVDSTGDAGDSLFPPNGHQLEACLTPFILEIGAIRGCNLVFGA